MICQNTVFVLQTFLYPEAQSTYAFASEHNQVNLSSQKSREKPVNYPLWKKL